MTQEAVVIEERHDGTRSVWNFGRREKHELTCNSGLVGEWIRINGDNCVPTKPTLSTTRVEVPPFPGKHVMLKVPAVRVRRVVENHGSAASTERRHCFWSPFLGPIHAFFDAHNIPQGVLLEVDVIKVCDTLKDMLEKKYGPRAEWMVRKGTINEVTAATEDKQLALLQTLWIERIEGVMVRRGDDNCAIAAELPDGSQKLFVDFDSNFEVGDVVSFIPMEVGLDAEVGHAVSCRLSRPGFAKPLGHDASQAYTPVRFLIPFSAFTPLGRHYRAKYLGIVDDSRNVLKSGNRMPDHVIARIDTQDGFFRMAVNDQFEPWALQATCVRVQGGHAFFEWFPKEFAKYPSFCVSKDRLVELTNIEPVPGQWYEMVARFYATPEEIPGDIQASILSARYIPKPPSASEFVERRSLTRKRPKKAKLEPEVQLLTAICTHIKGEDAFFVNENTHNEERRMFCASVQRFRECTANNGTTPGQWYELTVRFYARATPQRAHILATSVIPWSSLCAQASNYIVTSKQPSIAGTTSVKAKYEPEEWTLKAVCAYVKGEDSFFEPVPKESVKYALFQVRTVTFAEKTGCGEPIAGQSYMLTLKFATRSAKANHVPVAHVITAKTVGNRLSAVQFRQIETAVADSTSRQSPHVPVGDTTSSIPKQHGRSKYTGVVCYKDRDVCYVYSAQMGYEIPVDSRGRVLDAGDWVEFSVNDEKSIALNPAPAQPRFPTMPSHHSVLVKCSIMVSMDIRETDDTVTSNFVGNVRDIHGLARKVSPGVHSAAIRYVYEEGRDCGQWQLEYVYAKMIS